MRSTDSRQKAEKIKHQSLLNIDKDKEILEQILLCYKSRKEKPKEYQEICKTAVDFCLDVSETALETLDLADRISKAGNKMLASDFEICKLYGYASVEASIVNIKINLDSILDEEYKIKVQDKYLDIYNKAKSILNK